MNTELRNKVWSILPKEFKEEVKRHFFKKNAQSPFSIECDVLCKYFGHHNLTSDAGGEDEILCVRRKQVQEIYKTSKNIVRNEEYGTKMYSMHIQTLCVLESLFGTKCLPDETKQETKQETKSFQNGNTHYPGNHFPDVRNMVNTRLHIAAMAMAGALANKNVTIGRGAFESNRASITKTALMYADALIAECEKGEEV